MKILVAVSGGVDSSVTLCLLQEQGYEVIAVHFSLWVDPTASPMDQILPSKCCTTAGLNRMKSICRAQKIALHILSRESEFKQRVVDPFLQAYRSGETPNPCVWCNRNFKFAELIRVADQLQCTHIATGHYARTVESSVAGRPRMLLREAKDVTKDQSYFLAALDDSVLRRAIFPLGERTKREVFALAEHFHIPIDSSYRESQDVCFFPEKTPNAFLKRHLAHALHDGPIVHESTGKTVGTHHGLPLYTTGQRRGLGIGGLSIPLVVTRKDAVSNTLFVDEAGEILTNAVVLSDVFLAMKVDALPSPLTCRTRLHAARVSGSLLRESDDRFVFRFDQPQSSITAGQVLVLYHGDTILGCGTMNLAPGEVRNAR